MSASSDRSAHRDNPGAGPPASAVVKLNLASARISDGFYERLLANPGQTLEWWLQSDSESLAGSLDWAQLDPNLRISAVFKPRDVAKIDEYREAGRRGSKIFTVDEPPDFRNYIRFDIDPYDEAAAGSLARLRETLLADQRTRVESISIGGVIVNDGAILNGAEIEGVPINSNMNQGFFEPSADGGIGIGQIQSTCNEADGKGTWFVDVEQGWSLPHSEIAGKYHPDPISGVNRDWIWSRAAGTNGDFAPFGWHGLTTLGLILAKKGNGGLTGIAPESFGFLAAEWEKLAHTPYRERTAQAIKAAADLLDPGDVILIEGQQYFAQHECNLPVEADPAIFDAIKYATDQNITVIEPAGNNSPKGVDLDDYLERDSGAILVAAGNNNVENQVFEIRPESNFGSRVNCFADGDNIWSLDPEGRKGSAQTSFYQVPRGGTSTAAAIIAGVALVLQGIQRAQTPPKVISAAKMRSLLSDPGNGMQLAGGQHGVMPDLIKLENNNGGTLTTLGNVLI